MYSELHRAREKLLIELLLLRGLEAPVPGNFHDILKE